MSFASEAAKLLTNKYFLYFIAFLAVSNIIGYLVTNKLNAVVFFVLVCILSYNFSKNDDNIWERFSLLNLLYKKLYHQKFVKISLAPPRETLKIFGGYLSIEEFREVLIKNEKTYTVVKPPLISIIPKIEENISQNLKNKNVFPLVNENILNKTQNSLKLKRNKPVTNPNNTLQSFMDLKIL